MLLPSRCPVCRAPGPAPCAGCRARLRPAPELARPAGVDRCLAVLAYEGAGRDLLARLKYRNARAVVPALASAMAALVDPWEVDAVTWVPTTPARRRSRGFDQAQLLARSVARRLGRPCPRLLGRRPGPPQTGRPLVHRRAGPSFWLRRRPPARVLLVDDVVTSGATVAAAASVLRAGGCRVVSVLAAARTPHAR